jgi:hypothetical protein
MPQITVTLQDDLYMELIERLPKGLKSKFVNQAVLDAFAILRDENGVVLCGAAPVYARRGYAAASEWAWEENKRLEELKE